MRQKLDDILKSIDWTVVQKHYDLGNHTALCCRHFGFSRATCTEAVKRGLLKASRKKDYSKAVLRFNWQAIQAYYDKKHDGRECCAKFKCSVLTFEYAAKTGRICLRPAWTTSENLFTLKRYRKDSVHLKHRLLRERLLPYKCAKCGIWRWNGKILSLELHHKNGNGLDDRKENLEFNCPNCHTLTESYCGRKQRKTRFGELRSSYFKLIARIVAEQESSTVGVLPIDLRCKKPELNWQI